MYAGDVLASGPGGIGSVRWRCPAASAPASSAGRQGQRGPWDAPCVSVHRVVLYRRSRSPLTLAVPEAPAGISRGTRPSGAVVGGRGMGKEGSSLKMKVNAVTPLCPGPRVQGTQPPRSPTGVQWVGGTSAQAFGTYEGPSRPRLDRHPPVCFITESFSFIGKPFVVSATSQEPWVLALGCAEVTKTWSSTSYSTAQLS